MSDWFFENIPLYCDEVIYCDEVVFYSDFAQLQMLQYSYPKHIQTSFMV